MISERDLRDASLENKWSFKLHTLLPCENPLILENTIVGGRSVRSLLSASEKSATPNTIHKCIWRKLL